MARARSDPANLIPAAAGRGGLTCEEHLPSPPVQDLCGCGCVCMSPPSVRPVHRLVALPRAACNRAIRHPSPAPNTAAWHEGWHGIPELATARARKTAGTGWPCDSLALAGHKLPTKVVLVHRHDEAWTGARFQPVPSRMQTTHPLQTGYALPSLPAPQRAPVPTLGD